MKIFVAPPLLPYQELLAACVALKQECAGFHFDIMDAVFVPEIRFTITDINKLRQEPALKNTQFWVHLMVADPKRYIQDLMLCPGDIASFHYEAVHQPKAHRNLTVNMIEELTQILEHKNIMPSLAINPTTPLKSLLDALFLFEHILIMGVNPGKSGQPFINPVLKKIARLIAYKVAQELSLTITVDGGVNSQNITTLNDLDVDAITCTSAIFDAPDSLKALKELNKLI
ncbi:hypothetical protein EBU24_06935 [bacterium]|nr:hypothetical protein [bacterium]